MNQESSETSPGKDGGVAVSLPVVPSDRRAIRKSKNAPKRAIVLAIVQILIILHIVQWLIQGRTVTPLEPSESMQSLEQGYVNAGLILFAVALLGTLIFGRWFCGWGCHLVMLQDLCGWIMKKFGVHPRPFRSRILIWVPFVLALYMFVWPTFKRLALFPLLHNWGWEDATMWFKPVASWPGWSNHLMTDEFWATFTVIMAVPTLLVAGFGMVYFLGAKGFCTYGCPYGGFFAPLDEFAVGRIRVTDACEGCGHCTATCTSNVRVHEEVREYGMVVDPGCMKCLDCVSVCPNGALYYGFGRPAVSKGDARNKQPKKQYDLSLREDIVITLIFVLTFLSLRGLYLGETVPMLMVVAFAGVLTFILWKTSRLFRRKCELVRLQTKNLKWRGRITPAGWILTGLAALLAIFTIQNGYVAYNRYRGMQIDRAVTRAASREVVFAPPSVARPEGVADRAAAAIAFLERARGIKDGGAAVMTDPAIQARLAWMHIVRMEFDLAEAYLHSVIDRTGPHSVMQSDIAQLMLMQGRGEAALSYAISAYEARPDFGVLLARVISLFSEVRDPDAALTFLEGVVASDSKNAVAMRALADRYVSLSRMQEGTDLAVRALELSPDELIYHQTLANAYFMQGRYDDVRSVLEAAVPLFPRSPQLHTQLNVIYTQLGEHELAAEYKRKTEELGGG